MSDITTKTDYRDSSVSEVFQLTFQGSTHSIVYTPQLIRTFSKLRMSIKRIIFEKVFGILFGIRHACMVKCLLQDTHMSNVSNAAIADIGKQINSLVTISGHPYDLAPWERHSRLLQ